MAVLNDEPPTYTDAIAADAPVESLTNIGMQFPGCTGFLDADSWGHASPWMRKFDFNLRITADMDLAAVNDDPNATFNYARLSNTVDKSLEDASRTPWTHAYKTRPPYHLTAFAWHARLVDYIILNWPHTQAATLESVFPIARGGTDAQVTYTSEFHCLRDFEQAHAQSHIATLAITNIRANASFGHKARDQEMRQVILVSLKLRLQLPDERWQMIRVMPGGAHRLTQAIADRLNNYPHVRTLNKLAIVIRDIVNGELAEHAADDRPRPQPDELYQVNGIPPPPFRIDAPAQLFWLKVEAPHHLDTSGVYVEIGNHGTTKDEINPLLQPSDQTAPDSSEGLPQSPNLIAIGGDHNDHGASEPSIWIRARSALSSWRN